MDCVHQVGDDLMSPVEEYLEGLFSGGGRTALKIDK